MTKQVNELLEIFQPLLEEYKKLENPTDEELIDFVVDNADFFNPANIINILEILKTICS